jgi:glycosyltransferase involved in cell wall biosynthesis
VTLPQAPVVNLFDNYLLPHANDLAGEAGTDTPPEYFHWRRTAHAMDLLDLENGVHAWTHTAWQRDLFPPEYRDDFRVLHDGVEADQFRRREDGPRVVAGRAIPEGARVVSFVARYMDQLRGFDRFVALANRLLALRSDLLFVIVGATTVQRTLDVRYHNQDYRAAILGRTPLADPDRFWFLDMVPPATVVEVLALSDLHVYPSRPYPVARSLLEAMAAGCVVLAWDTEPVREVIAHGQTGILVADEEEGARWASRVLDDPAGHRPLGEAAADLVRERYNREVVLPQLAAWFDQLVARTL